MNILMVILNVIFRGMNVNPEDHPLQAGAAPGMSQALLDVPGGGGTPPVSSLTDYPRPTSLQKSHRDDRPQRSCATKEGIDHAGH